MIGDEQLGDARVVQDLDPVFAQIALEPGPGDIEPLVHAAGEMNFPGRPLARLDPTRLADQELGRSLPAPADRPALWRKKPLRRRRGRHERERPESARIAPVRNGGKEHAGSLG